MKKLTSILLIILFALTIHANAQRRSGKNPVADTGRPQFTFLTKRIYDFGSVAINTSATYEFQFKNTGSSPLTITKMHASDRAKNDPEKTIQIRYPEKPVKPGKYAYISVTLTAKDQTGSFKDELFATSNAAPDNRPFLLIVGAVTPKHEEARKETDMHGYFELLSPVVQSNVK